MNRAKWLMLIGGGLLLLSGLWWLLIPKQDALPHAESAFTLSSFSTDVVHTSKEGVIETVQTPTDAYAGDQVETSLSGRGALEAGDGTLTTIDYGTSLIVRSAEPTQTSLGLRLGSVWARVQKLFGKGEYFEIETQNAVATVRGTSFGLRYANGSTFLWVTEGTVIIFPVLDDVRHEEQGVSVPAGKKAEVHPDGTITLSDITETDKTDTWYLFNNPDVAHAVDSTGSSGTAPVSTGGGTSLQNGGTSVGTVGAPTSTPPAPVKFEITAISPQTILVDDPTTLLALDGTGLSDVTTVLVGRYTLPPSAVVIVSSTHIDVDVSIMNEGTYTVEAMKKNGDTAIAPKSLTIQARPEVPASGPNDQLPTTYVQ